jgi:hypothetical protein
MKMRWTLSLWLVASCSGEDPHPCDDGVPTCDSSLVVLLEEGDLRTEFTLTLKDDVGLDIVVDCPLPEENADGVFDDYTVICGGGRLTISTFRYFSDVISVQLEESPPRDLPVEPQSKGGDFCGNTCTNGTVQL